MITMYGNYITKRSGGLKREKEKNKELWEDIKLYVRTNVTCREIMKLIKVYKSI